MNWRRVFLAVAAQVLTWALFLLVAYAMISDIDATEDEAEALIAVFAYGLLMLLGAVFTLLVAAPLAAMLAVALFAKGPNAFKFGAIGWPFSVVLQIPVIALVAENDVLSLLSALAAAIVAYSIAAFLSRTPDTVGEPLPPPAIPTWTPPNS